jgi:hypothetical protein
VLHRNITSRINQEELRIEKEPKQFFVLPYPRGGDTVITGDRNYSPKNRIFFTDLLFNYFNDLNASVDYITIKPEELM